MKDAVSTFRVTRWDHRVGLVARVGGASQLVEDLERAVDDDDWPTAYDIGDRLSVEVTHWARTK